MTQPAAYGLWSLVVINSLVFIVFAFSFTRPRTGRDWRAFGAFAGFEYVAIHAGECHDPVRSITRATIVAVPIIVLMFILGTSSVLGMIPVDDIDLIAPIPQRECPAWALSPPGERANRRYK